MSHPLSTGVGHLTHATITTTAPLRGASLTVSDFIRGAARRQPIRVRLPDTLDTPTQLALVQAVQRLARLRKLERGWDGERAEPLTDDACATAIRLLTALALPAPPTAQLVPLEDGGLQIEFHVKANGKTNDVELEIDASGEVHVYILVSDAEIIMNREVPPPLLPTTMPIIKRHLMRMSRILQEQA